MSKKKLMVMAIDPSTKTGVSIFKIENDGYTQVYADDINTTKIRNNDLTVINPERQKFIHEEIKFLIKDYDIDIVLMEKWVAPNGMQSKEVFAIQGSVLGAIGSALGDFPKLKIVEYSVQERYELFEILGYKPEGMKVVRKGKAYTKKGWASKRIKEISKEISQKYNLDYTRQGARGRLVSDDVADANVIFLIWWHVVNGKEIISKDKKAYTKKPEEKKKSVFATLGE